MEKKRNITNEVKELMQKGVSSAKQNKAHNLKKAPLTSEARDPNREPKRPPLDLPLREAIAAVGLFLAGEEGIDKAKAFEILKGYPKIGLSLYSVLYDEVYENTNEVENKEDEDEVKTYDELPKWLKSAAAELIKPKVVKQPTPPTVSNLMHSAWQKTDYHPLILQLQEQLVKTVLGFIQNECGSLKGVCYVQLSLVENHHIYFYKSSSPKAWLRHSPVVSYVDLLNPVSNPTGRLTVAGSAALARETKIVWDVKSYEEYVERNAKVKAQVSVPGITNGDVNCVISVEVSNSNIFEGKLVDMLELVASLFAREIQVTLELIEREREVMMYKTLYDIGRAIKSCKDEIELLAVLDKVINGAFALIEEEPSDLCFCHIAQREESEHLHLIANSPDIRQDLVNGDFRVYIGKDRNPYAKIGIAGRAFIEGRTINVPDVSKDGDFIQFKEGINSQLSVPLTHRGTTVGVLSFEHYKFNAFGKKDVEQLEFLANFVADTLASVRSDKFLNVQLNEYSKKLVEVSNNAEQVVALAQELPTITQVCPFCKQIHN